MIWNAYLSEWIKLRRPRLLGATYLAIAALTVLVTVVTFARAGQRNADRGDFVSLAELASTDGLVHGLTRASALLGVIAFAVAAAQLAGEYTNGTLRNLLVRQPRRPVLLGGKYLAVVTFMIGAIVIATAAGVASAFVMASVRNISTTEWTSPTGLGHLASGFGDVALAVVGYTTLGMFVAIVVRSPGPAIGIGLVFLLPFEAIFNAVVTGSDRWLPGQLLDAVAQQGTSTVSYGHSLAASAVYLAVAALVGLLLFQKRDVTA